MITQSTLYRYCLSLLDSVRGRQGRSGWLLTIPLVFLTNVVIAQEKQEPALKAGHSIHGEVFNEGPRQKAMLMKGTGIVDFPTTSDVALAKQFVNQGIGQVHGYWRYEAERSFRQAAMLDPDCAIAYWGMARANIGNTKRATGFIKEAVSRKDKASELEGRLIDALNAYVTGKKKKSDKVKDYVAALKDISAKFPDVLEVEAMAAYAMYRNRSVLKISYEDVDNTLKAVLTKQPMHPVHHFRIHLWDRKDAAKALDSAAKCGQAASDIAHMWHMPGHIYAKLLRHSDAAWQQEASARTDHANMMRDHVMPDQIHNYAHNNEWLIRSLSHVGRWRDAIDLAMNMTELPRHPKYNTLKRGSASYGRTRLFDELYRYELWDDLITLCNQAYLAPTKDESQQLKRLRYLGIAYAETKQTEKVDEVLAKIDVHLKKAVKKKAEIDAKEAKRKADEEAKKKAAAEAKRKAEEAKRKAELAKYNGDPPPALPEPKQPVTKKPTVKKPTLRPPADPTKPVKAAIAAIKGHKAMAEGDYKAAATLLKQGSVDTLLLARAQVLSGQKDLAIKTMTPAMNSRKKRVQPLAAKIEVLWHAGKVDEARAAFEDLQAMSGSIQFGNRVFARLAPIAKELDLPEDWRQSQDRPKDFGKRPELDSLGPFRWQPVAATDWKLADNMGKQWTLSQFKGKPVVVIFYLGYGCLHCAEQLRAFAPAAEKFKEAGISLIAISTDSQEDLKESIDNFEGKFPFPLVSNEKLDVFKSWRVFDDFEQTSLHGTFLIDEQGLIRWQDISYEPFQDPNFLLEESKRLLAQDDIPKLEFRDFGEGRESVTKRETP
ncbi:MAG: alkyl hydroperoxide reductase [Planctomycetaceae bacterium]|nr:alkyl hydroperoxide reductase [Planctomycetaceae bacterium]